MHYRPEQPDGKRLVVLVGETAYPQPVPDWIWIPTTRYADSQYNAIVSLFGETSTQRMHDIVYHEAFGNTLLGLRMLRADILLRDLSSTWQLPKFGGTTVLGAGETEPKQMDMDAAKTISGVIRGKRFQSWVLTDVGEPVKVDVADGQCRLRGSPYYYLWISDFVSYRREVERLQMLASQARTAGDVAAHNRHVLTANQLSPAVSGVDSATDALRRNVASLRSFNPAVWNAAESVMHYAALFRLLKGKDRDAWRRFLKSLEAVRVEPSVVTPTRMPTGIQYPAWAP